MSLNLEQLKSVNEKTVIDNVSIRAASTIFGDQRLQNAIWLKEERFMLSMRLEKEDAENLINVLNKHIENIKENELEVIAMQTKAAA